MTTFDQRNSLTQRLHARIPDLFSPQEVDILPFGIENIVKDNVEFANFFSSPEANFSHESMLIKFAPDFILLTKTKPRKMYFLEVKVSVTPLYSVSRWNEIRAAHPSKNIKLSDVGDIAREAWNAYNNLYPNTIILDVCSYNPKLVMAQFVSKIDCLRCYKDPYNGYDCAQCPVKKGEFFEYSRNFNSSGSQTPHTNIDYSTMLPIKEFFASIGISVNDAVIQDVKYEFKCIGVKFGSSFNASVSQNAITILNKEGCYWL